MTHYFDVFETPYGWMGVVASDKGLRRTTLPQPSPEDCAAQRDLEDFRHYTRTYRKNFRQLSHNHIETMERLGRESGIEINRLREVTNLLYKIGVFRLDRFFGGVVDALREHGFFDESLVIFTADHAEILYRDNAPLKWSHGLLEPEVLGVPLIVRGPGIEAGRYAKVTRSIDLFPTLVGLSGLPALPPPFGASPTDDTVGRDPSAAWSGGKSLPRNSSPSAIPRSWVRS